jgi:CheY-like chemotaxis protein
MASALALPHLPPWLVSAAAALCVGVLLRVLDEVLRALGKRLAARLTPVPPPPPRSRSVLVVDDHAGVRQLLALALREELPGVAVYEARSGAEARGLASLHGCGAVVCDLALPDELGADVLAAIGRPGDVLMSGVIDADALDAAAAHCGAIAMRKPLDRALVAAAVRARLDG